MRSRWPLLVTLLLFGCGSEDGVTPPSYPALAGVWQYRSEIREGAVVCIEHGTLDIAHPGQATFSGSGTITMDCYAGLALLEVTTVTVPISNGVLGEETPRGSWSVSFQGRPGWSYGGEAFISAGGSLVVQGQGQATLDPGNGQSIATAFDWTICRQFQDPSDFVERGCV